MKKFIAALAIAAITIIFVLFGTKILGFAEETWNVSGFGSLMSWVGLLVGLPTQLTG